MDSNNKIILKESLYIAAVTLILNVIMQTALLIFGFWNKGVLFCSILGYICGVLNFYLLGMGLKIAINEDNEGMRKVIGISRIIRIILIFAAVLIGSLTGGINVIFVLIPLLFPRIAISLRPFLLKD